MLAVQQLTEHYPRGLLYPAAMMTLGAGAIHSAVAPDHLREFLSFGLLFLAVGTAQAALAVGAVLRPSRRVLTGIVAVALGCLAVWAVSRSVGLPLGPTPGKPEPIQTADVMTAILEIASVLLIAPLVVTGPRSRATGLRWLASTAPAVLVVAPLTAVGVLAGLNPLPHAINMGTAAPGSAAIAMDLLTEPPGSQPIKSFTLTAQVAQVAGRAAWTYNGTVPGPELRVSEGDRVRVTLINRLPAPTAIHWHGLRLPNAEDGVPGVTQNAVPPGSTYVYEFVAKDPGTYWYHSHQEASNQINLGLYGALVVEPRQGPRYDRDDAVILGAANVDQPAIHLDARPGELVRLRLIDAFSSDMSGYPELLTLVGAPYRVVALDGHDLNQPQELGPELLPMGMGQRYDLVFRVPASGRVSVQNNRPKTGSLVPRREWVNLGDEAAPPPVDAASLPTFDLTTYGVPAPDPVASRASFDVNADLSIANYLGFRYGDRQFIHTFNGKAFPDTEPIIVREGQYVRVRLTNLTDEYHPIHLHGHYFSVLSKNGTRSSGSPVHLDSVLVGPHETWEVAFLADNPGLWMLHCHVLIHAAVGLSTMVSYGGISTPYVIGTQSGNFPD